MTPFPLHRFEQILQNLDLDLRGKLVLTEAATGAYSVTALISAASGAETRILARDSAYGTAEEAYTEVETRAAELGCFNRIRRYDTRESIRFDIITNSGHLRPLDKGRLDLLKDTGLVALMYENWEFRESDLDSAYCLEKSIPVVGLNERHPDVDVFGFLGDMAAKLAFDSGRPLYRSNALIFTNNDFGPWIAKRWTRFCETVWVCGKNPEEYADIDGIRYVGDFPEPDLEAIDIPLDFVVYSAVPFIRRLAGKGIAGGFDPIRVPERHRRALWLRFCGGMETGDFDDAGIAYFPAAVKDGHMGVLPSHLGYEPVIRLQAGSLKAAQLHLLGETHYRGIPLATPLPINRASYAGG